MRFRIGEMTDVGDVRVRTYSTNAPGSLFGPKPIM
jgi:hypothetical protein